MVASSSGSISAAGSDPGSALASTSVHRSAPAGDALGPDRDHMHRRRRVDLAQPLQPLVVGDQHHRCAVVHAEGHLRRRPPRVHADHRGTEADGRPVAHDPLRVVAHGDRDPGTARRRRRSRGARRACAPAAGSRRTCTARPRRRCTPSRRARRWPPTRRASSPACWRRSGSAPRGPRSWWWRTARQER